MSRMTVTVNLPIEGEKTSWEDYDINKLRVELNPAYMIMGKEQGEVTERKHFQGYLEFAPRRKAGTIENIFRKTFPLPISVHFETAKASAEDNINYCSKTDEDPYIFGEAKASEQGKRNDLQEVSTKILNGATIRDIAREHPETFIKFPKGIEALHRQVQPQREGDVVLIFLWGETGSGKTLNASKYKPEKLEYTSSDFLLGYKGGLTVLFDDFDWKRMPVRTFLKITDNYMDNTFNVKNGEVQWCPKTIIFTSNDNPQVDWYKEETLHRDAILRRMEEYGTVINLNKNADGTARVGVLDRFFTRVEKRAEPEPDTEPIIVESDEEPGPAQRIPTAEPRSEFCTPANTPQNSPRVLRRTKRVRALEPDWVPATEDAEAHAQWVREMEERTGETTEEEDE